MIRQDDKDLNFKLRGNTQNQQFCHASCQESEVWARFGGQLNELMALVGWDEYRLAVVRKSKHVVRDRLFHDLCSIRETRKPNTTFVVREGGV